MAAPIIDRWRLPPPVLARDGDFEALFQSRLSHLRDIWRASQALRQHIPDFDTWLLETEPATILLQSAAFGDAHFVAELNDWARVVLLAHFATGSDLEAHAAREGLERFAGESDTALLERIVLERRGKAAYGADPWYLRHARNADPRVREVAITGNGRRRVELAILSTDNDGVPSADLIEKLNRILPLPPVARNNDLVSVVPAILTLTDVEVDVWLEPGAPESLLAHLPETVASRWNAGTRLGRDLTQSWLLAQIHIPGVYRVECDMPDQIVPANRGIAIGAVRLRLRGRNH